MSRSDRRYEGGPEYALSDVRTCIALGQFAVTRKAEYGDGPRVLPAGTVKVFATIKAIVLDLVDDDWRFAQFKDGAWADVYETKYEEVDLWVKMKVEIWPTAKQYAVVVSFHEWDHSRPI